MEVEIAEVVAPGSQDGAADAPAHGSLKRGLILHKLLEEILSGELAETAAAISARGAALATQLSVPTDRTPDPGEVAQAVLRGLGLPEIVVVRDRLQAELPVALRRMQGDVESFTFGIADAVAVEADGAVSLVVDWKSDVNPSPATILSYRQQVEAYLQATGTPAGYVVFLTSGKVESVLRS